MLLIACVDEYFSSRSPNGDQTKQSSPELPQKVASQELGQTSPVSHGCAPREKLSRRKSCPARGSPSQTGDPRHHNKMVDSMRPPLLSSSIVAVGLVHSKMAKFEQLVFLHHCSSLKLHICFALVSCCFFLCSSQAFLLAF